MTLNLNTLLLDQTDWDLVLDAAGNIAMATAPYALAQDVASAARLFSGELWYDKTQGIPYFENVLGKLPPPSLVREYLINAALSVPEVVSATVILEPVGGDRTQIGQIQFTDSSGATNSVGI